MGLFSFIGDIFKPAATLIDNLHTSDAEKLQLRNALARIEADVVIKQMEIQAQLSTAMSNLASAEAGSESWFTRNYRPIIISSMFLMIVGESFGLLKTELPELFWNIFGATFGVMSVAPSIAKAGNGILKDVINAIKKK